jgi:hypothetical protein
MGETHGYCIAFPNPEGVECYSNKLFKCSYDQLFNPFRVVKGIHEKPWVSPMAITIKALQAFRKHD